MDQIGYLIHNSTEELWEDVATKHEDQQKKVQYQLGILQHLLETTCIRKYYRSRDRPSTGPRRETTSI
jgi:hypothetical protein